MSKTRDKIICAMTEMARGRGFYGVPIEEVAARAGVSKRTVYRHFAGKDELVQVVMMRFIQEVAGQIEEIVNSGGQPDSIFVSIAGTVSQQGLMISIPVMQDLQLHYPQTWKLLEQFRAERMKKFLEVVFEQNHGNTYREVDPRIMITAFTSAIQAVLNPEFLLGNGMSFQDTAGQLFKLLMNGVLKEIRT